MWNSIIQFYQTNKDWIDNLLSGALVTVVLAIIGFIWWYRQQKRQVRIIEPSLPFTKIAPNSNVIPIIYKRDEKDKSPLADHNIIYQHRMADRNFTNELVQNLEQNRWLIIVGPTGIGKTREAAEVAQRLNHEGWTVLVLKLGEWLERPENKQLEAIGTDRKLLFFLDDLNSYMRRSLQIDQNPQAKDSPLAAINIPLQERLLKTLEAYETHCTRPEEVRVIATARDEKEPESPGQPSEWDKLQWDKYPELWERFQLVKLPSPEDGAIVELLQDTIPQTNIKAETDYSSIAAYNDSTFRNVVENLVRLENRQLPLNPANYQATLRGNWQKRYQDAIKRDNLAKYIYAAVDLLRQCNISLEPFIVEPTARFIAKGNMWQQLWYRWQIKQSLADLIARENILEPRDGQIEAKGKQVELNDYLRPLKQLIWQLFEEKPLEMLPSLAGFTLKLYELKRYQDALKGFNRLVSFAPQGEDGWVYRGSTFYYLEQYQEAIASWDRALEIKPDYHEAWYGRGWAVCSLSKNRISTPSLEALIYRKPIVALNDREPHIFALREALPHLIQGSPPWGQIYRYLGEAYLEHSQYKEKASPYWREAIGHYQIALPILSEKDFPEDHLEILQGLIRAHLSLQEIPEARFYQQQGRHLFTRLRAQKRDKPAFEAKFSSFSHLEIDLLIEENHPLDAIEQAEFYKNRCLTWILDNWQENPTSPDYATIQSLTSPNKAIIYWYLSEDNLTTFIITAEADPVIVEPEQRRQSARQFRTWLTEWDKQYRDYASKKETENKQNHPWRLSLNSRFAQLKRILQIDKILEPLPVSVNSLILIPHRDLHRFPLHTLFPEKYTATYLPSAQVGLRPQSSDFSYSPLLSVEDPKTEQKPMDFAQLESAIISHILQPSQRISPKKASRENVRKALENAHKTFHFTGHGFYDSFRPQESAIALSDGLLTVRDINKLNLSSYRLVCLAACETALTGKDGITTEYVGLVSAFLAAGATNVVSTLWPVKEISSAWFMINFYQRLLAGESPALALKNTQNWLKNITWQQLAHWIEQLRQLPSLTEGVDRLEARAANILKEGSTIGLDQLTEYSDPYYWAAYTLTGQD
ncbi:MAG: CHAT domain-containing protein [Microcystis panniformis]